MHRTLPLLTVLAACGSEDTHTLDRTDDELLDDLSARIAERAQWSQPEGWDGGRQWVTAGSPHGTWVDIRSNGIATDAAASEAMPLGTLLTKDQHTTEDGDDAPYATVALWKLGGLDPDGSGYFWARWEDGEADMWGDSLEMCVNCHSSGTDFIRSAVDRPGTPDPSQAGE